ncbi:hypothetical protein ACTVZO_17595 [Streptomyces sp. IBSNAI002]|uniref:hypothetical protein n=1 Tax=Streptomyces sp. IBSNAI002 TaxID=3457500 RepID=UPI003FD35D41
MSSLQNYKLEQVAELLCCYPSYLEENLASLPHQKMGKAVAFAEEDILEIKQMHRVRPSLAAVPAAPEGSPALAQIRPKRASRRSG